MAGTGQHNVGTGHGSCCNGDTGKLEPSSRFAGTDAPFCCIGVPRDANATTGGGFCLKRQHDLLRWQTQGVVDVGNDNDNRTVVRTTSPDVGTGTPELKAGDQWCKVLQPAMGVLQPQMRKVQTEVAWFL